MVYNIMDSNKRLVDSEEIELARFRIYQNAKKFELVVGVVKNVVNGLLVAGCIYIIMHELRLWATQSPEAISSLAKVIEAFKLDSITAYIVTGAACIGWGMERKGKKRAISDKAYYQRIAEKDDAYRSTSGLTPEGDTPVGEEGDD